jgi:hypothetical protein
MVDKALPNLRAAGDDSIEQCRPPAPRIPSENMAAATNISLAHQILYMNMKEGVCHVASPREANL